MCSRSDLSVATLYRRFTTKKNLVCWQPDEQTGMAALVSAIEFGQGLSSAARGLAETLSEEAVGAVEATARARLQLIASHPALQAAARTKGESFITEILAASEPLDRRPLLERETEARCVAVAFEAATNAWLRGEGSVRGCASGP